jgi:hypothetical protein
MRHPRRVYRPQAGRPHYLFAENATIHEVILHLQERLKKELAELSPEALLQKSADEISAEVIRQYTLDTPKLDRENIGELPAKATQLEVPQFTQDRAFSGPGPHIVPATQYAISIPFTGDDRLFKYSSSGFGSRIPGQLVDQTIVLTYIAEHPNPAVIKREFDSRMAQIENALQFVREQAEQWNQRLPSLVKPAVEKIRPRSPFPQSIPCRFFLHLRTA